jgi:peptidoglycan/LPS O-acetylase OafA/YrhL
MAKYWPSNYRRSLQRALLVESIALLAISIYLAVAPFFSKTTHVIALLFEILFSLLGAAALNWSRNSFKTGRQSGRGIALLANGIGLGVSYFAYQGKAYEIALPLAALCFVTLVLLFITLAQNHSEG